MHGKRVIQNTTHTWGHVSEERAVQVESQSKTLNAYCKQEMQLI